MKISERFNVCSRILNNLIFNLLLCFFEDDVFVIVFRVKKTKNIKEGLLKNMPGSFFSFHGVDIKRVEPFLANKCQTLNKGVFTK